MTTRGRYWSEGRAGGVTILMLDKAKNHSAGSVRQMSSDGPRTVLRRCSPGFAQCRLEETEGRSTAQDDSRTPCIKQQLFGRSNAIVRPGQGMTPALS